MGWRQTAFVTEFLPQQGLNMRRELQNFRQQKSLRDALNGCYDYLYPYLPLLLDDIVDASCDRSSLAAPQGCVVVAEKIYRVPDAGRADKRRIDFFVYHPCGKVVRHHPGNKGSQRSVPHEMANNSSLFLLIDAVEHGVGRALHQRPPGAVENLNSLAPPQGWTNQCMEDLRGQAACTRVHLAELSLYDVQMTAWKNVYPQLMNYPAQMLPLELTNGALMPWWVWMANSPTGVLELHLTISNGNRVVLAELETGGYARINAKGKIVSIPRAEYVALRYPTGLP